MSCEVKISQLKVVGHLEAGGIEKASAINARLVNSKENICYQNNILVPLISDLKP